MRRRFALLCLAWLVVGAPVTAALADGDPASDVLLAENVFYPYNPPVLPRLERTLNGEAAAAARAHFHLKVAIIDSPYDLGVVPEMLGHPQSYARFLDQELRLFLGPHPPLLVVMPGGYGNAGLPGGARSAAAGLPRPTGSTSNDLVRAAIAAVPKLAAAAGHPIARGGGSPDAGGGGGVWTVTIVALVAAALAAGVLAVRRRVDRSA
jgi:hypothetical protein